ncbi:cytochrome b/b6 domain-containing protein [Salinisphaera sp. T31B1]|uniref:cytochrome b n=1 Tax=Salinisphaera sp. T31B1 TaxID=727963 RepID=UPI0033422543
MTPVPSRYASVFRSLHWLLLAALILQFAIVFSFGLFDEHSTGHTVLFVAHTTTGTIILIGGALLLLARLTTATPSNAGLPVWQQKLSALVHWSLYLLLFVQPLGGIAMTMLHGHTVPLFGLFEIPQLLPESKGLGAALGEFHEIVAWVFAGLIGFHAVAALYHYWVVRDDILQRMR